MMVFTFSVDIVYEREHIFANGGVVFIGLRLVLCCSGGSRCLEEFPPISPDTSVSLWDLSGLTLHLVEHMLLIVSS